MNVIAFTDASVSKDGCFSASIILSEDTHLKTVTASYENVDAVTAEILGAVSIVDYLETLSASARSCVIYTDCLEAVKLYKYARRRKVFPQSYPQELKRLVEFGKTCEFAYTYMSADTNEPNGILTCHTLCKKMRSEASCGMDM